MTGAFATWQPEYAARGIPTFPVRIDADGKRPAVKNYLKLGTDNSKALATRFPESEAFGFGVGRRSGVTVLDVDSPDEKVLADALDRHGQTSIVIRSGGGKFQAWYRHNGERRMIRPDRSRPIDILGAGYVIAPPSRGLKTPYQFLQGSLDDLWRLPALQNLPAVAPSPKTRLNASTVTTGARNDTLFRRCRAAARHCDDLDALIDVARTQNDTFVPPLEDSEVVKTARSAWGYEQRGINFVGSGNVVEATHCEVDTLLQADPDAYVLLMVLRRHHWGREQGFLVANAMADTMPGGGWRRQRLASARATLEAAGKIVCVHSAGRRTPAVYSWSKGVQNCPAITTPPSLPSPVSGGRTSQGCTKTHSLKGGPDRAALDSNRSLGAPSHSALGERAIAGTQSSPSSGREGEMPPTLGALAQTLMGRLGIGAEVSAAGQKGKATK